MFNSNFDFAFSVFPVIFGIAFVGIFIVIIITVVTSVGQWSKNNQSPVLTVQAEVTSKRTNTTHHTHMMNDMPMTSTDTTYYITFEVPSGSRVEFHVSGQEYGQLREGDRGKLTFQGTRYLGFQRR